MDIKNAGISTIRILFAGAPRVHIPIKCIYLTAIYIQLHAEVVFKNLLDNTSHETSRRIWQNYI